MKKNTKEIIIWMFVLALITIFFVWAGTLAKNYVLTLMHEDKIKNMRFIEHEEPLSDFDWYRITSYSDAKLQQYV